MRHKYRAWDTILCEMHDLRGFAFDKRGNGFGVIYFAEGGFKTFGPGEIILKQFTGLCDKNGVEIYDGDIVKLCYGIPPTFDTLLIEYADDENVGDISVSGWWMKNIRPNGCSSSLCKTYEPDLEVIGSIHSNPELIET